MQSPPWGRAAAWRAWYASLGVVWCLVLLVAATGQARADTRLGLSPCALLAEAPGPTHPLRRQGPFVAAFKALDKAGNDAAAAGRAVAAFVTARDRLFADAVRAFTFKGEDPATFDTRAAQRFLVQRVLTANAPLRIGRETFELAPPVVAGLMLAACRGGAVPTAIDEGRRATGADAAALRAGAALLLLFSGEGLARDVDEARRLMHGVDAQDFLSAFVLAEIAARGEDAAAARALHEAVANLVTTADQREVWLQQQKRLR